MGGILYHTALLAPSLQDADPWSIGDIGILDNNQLANGPGISQRAAAARTQRLWRWLVKPQASSLTAGPIYYRINLERNNYGQRSKRTFVYSK